MAQFKKEHQQKFWHSPIILIILFCVLALFLYNMVGLVSKERETAKKKAVKKKATKKKAVKKKATKKKKQD